MNVPKNDLRFLRACDDLETMWIAEVRRTEKSPRREDMAFRLGSIYMAGVTRSLADCSDLSMIEHTNLHAHLWKAVEAFFKKARPRGVIVGKMRHASTANVARQ
jgi:hypothetical protein